MKIDFSKIVPDCVRTETCKLILLARQGEGVECPCEIYEKRFEKRY